MVTHDLRAALRGDRILYMSDGSIRAELRLPRYQDDAVDRRESELITWLTGLGW